jgi:hypothetical protein
MKNHMFNIERTIFLPFIKEYHVQGTHSGISQLEIGTSVEKMGIHQEMWGFISFHFFTLCFNFRNPFWDS